MELRTGRTRIEIMAPVLIVQLVDVFEIVAEFLETFPVRLLQIHINQNKFQRFVG